MGVIACSVIVSPAFAELSYNEELSVAAAIEESLGHFWAIEKNLDDKNIQLATMHAGHPISELYPIMKPEIQEFDSELDNKIKQSLTDVYETTQSNASRDEINKSIDNARILLQKVNTEMLGSEYSNTSFKLDLIKELLSTSEHEYEEAIVDGKIKEIVEYQDSTAFVTRSQELFDSIKTELPQHPIEATEHYDELWSTINNMDDPSQFEIHVDAIISEINEIQGNKQNEVELTTYVYNIKELLSQTKTEYENGNSDVALSLATKAYLDNFEYLEGPLVDAGKSELKDNLEELMRVELRDMIKNGASSSEINDKIDAILTQMDEVAVSVPEFGSISMIMLFVGIVSTIIISMQKNLLRISI